MALKKVANAVSQQSSSFSDDLRAKLSDGHVDRREAKDLAATWGRKPLTAADARELKYAVLGNTNNIAPNARGDLQKLVERTVKLVKPEGPRQFWDELSLKALGDGRISTRDAHRLAADWGSKPMTAIEAQQATQALLSTTGTFESNEAIVVMQRFLQDKLPGLVADKENLPRDFNTELRVALMDDGHLDHGDVKRLIDGWKKQAFTPAQAKGLSEAVLKNTGSIDPGDARTTLQHFLERDLPKRTSSNPDGTTARRDRDLDVRLKTLGDGKIDKREAGELVKVWDDPTTTPAEAEAIRQALDGAKTDGSAKNALNRFVNRNLPRLIVGQALTSPNNAKLTWTPPFANVDGSPLTNLAGYTVEYGKTAGAPDHTATVTDPAATGFTVDSLTPGTWYFRVKSRNSDNEESAPSNEASKTIQ